MVKSRHTGQGGIVCTEGRQGKGEDVGEGRNWGWQFNLLKLLIVAPSSQVGVMINFMYQPSSQVGVTVTFIVNNV